jgi:enoyl-CoA hydratase/carnithine racemase
MSMTGEVINASTALRAGLVTEVVAHGKLIDRALSLAGAVAEVPAETMRELKRMYMEGSAGSVGVALDAERRIGAGQTPDWSGLDERRLAVRNRIRAQLPTE